MMDTCRDRSGMYRSAVFNVYACAMCYQYLLELRTPNIQVRRNQPSLEEVQHLLWTTDSQNFTWSDMIPVDFMNISVVKMMCKTLKEADCKLWSDCCKAAIQCCHDQMTTPVVELTTPFCPRTWDGFSCVNDTMAGTTARLKCPSYIDGHTSEAELARKYCTENGSWYSDKVKGQEWTDYTPCIPLENYRIMFYVSVICHAISLTLTAPASIIFLAFRQLREQHRVQIHLNMFLSFMLTNVIWILWENLVYSDRLDNAENTLMHENTVGCKILYSLTRYTISANLFWMFLEGVHLLRLIVNAFVLPTSLYGYYLFGWVGPLVFLLIYIGFRNYHGDERCWVYMMEGYEWWIYTPNLLILLANGVSLAWIIYTLTTQIHVHPNEPSSYRRALRAMILLTPLFGLQMIFVIYRPINEDNWALEIIAIILKSSQGAIVALILCYSNRGVRTEIESYLKNVRDWLTFQTTSSKINRKRRDTEVHLKIRVHKVSSTEVREVDTH